MSTEAPHFYTSVSQLLVTVSSLPRPPSPIIGGVAASYSLGTTLQATCSTYAARPAPAISWHLNGDIIEVTL